MTRRVALIGHPLRRRHSEIMQNAAFAANGIDAAYELRPLEPDGVAGFFEEVRGADWLGFGVTAPYKRAVMEHLDLVEPGATAIGAVNNGVRLDDGSLAGFNTDASGFISAVSATGTLVSGRSAVVVGAGGAARAVVWALLDAGADGVFVANRSVDRARRLADDLSGFGAIEAGGLDGQSMREAMSSAVLAVNATTMGMTTDTVAFDVGPLPDTALVFDLVYMPPETPLLRSASARGLAVCNGLEMLIRQGEIAFERWTGVPDTAETMRHALESWLATAPPEA